MHFVSSEYIRGQIKPVVSVERQNKIKQTNKMKGKTGNVFQTEYLELYISKKLCLQANGGRRARGGGGGASAVFKQ